MACLPMAHWYVLRGDWLWWGYGMMPVTTPAERRKGNDSDHWRSRKDRNTVDDASLGTVTAV